MSETVATRQNAVKAGEAFDALLHHVVTLNRLFGAAGEAFARPAGQTLARTLVLRQLENEPAPVAEIARAVGLKRQSVQRVADRLAEDGLLGYEDNPKHRRSKLARLTKSGRASLERIAAEQRTWTQNLGRQIGIDKVEQTNELLHEILGAVQDASEPKR